MVEKLDNISMDIDLNIATGYGSVSVENTSSSSLLVRISNARTLREIIRKRSVFERMLESTFGQSLIYSFDTKVLLNGKTIALLEGAKVSEAKRLFIAWQYLLARLGL